jgi:hypothetical protein
MPKISVDHKTSTEASSALEKIKNFFETDPDLKKIDPKMSAKFDEKNLSGKVTSSQFKADISIKAAQAGALVSVIVDLPLLLTPIKGKVEEILRKKLNKYLA